MMASSIAVGQHGFLIYRGGDKSPWSISIESMVPVTKRTELSHYYILVRKNGKLLDRVYLVNGEATWVYDKKEIAKYISVLAEDIIMTGDINKHMSGPNSIDNRFTRLKTTRA